MGSQALPTAIRGSIIQESFVAQTEEEASHIKHYTKPAFSIVIAAAFASCTTITANT